MTQAVLDEKKRSHQNPVAAIMDAKKHNQANRDNFSDAEHELADELFERANDAYFRSRIYRTNRKDFIAVKIENPQLSDRVTPAAHQLKAWAAENNIESVQTASSLVYRVHGKK